MNRSGDIAAVCREHLLKEKVIVTPASSGGRQLREGCARDGTPWLHLHAMTVEALARHILGTGHPAVAGRLSHGQALRALAVVCERVITTTSLYGPLRGNRGFHRALLQSFEDCRLAGLSPASLDAAHAASPARANEFRRLAAAFAAHCAEAKRCTRAQLIAAACAHCAQQAGPDRIIMIESASDEELSVLERRLLERAGTVLHLDAAPRSAPRIHFRHAEREEWEARNAFRMIHRQRKRWDDAEIVLLRRDLLPLIYELSRQLDIPCTFDPGVPLHYSKAARTVTAYLYWISSDFDAAQLIRMMYDGVPDFSEWKSDGVRGGRLSCAAMLREAAVGWGRERYLPRIDARIRALETDDGNAKTMSEYQANRAWIARLLEVTPATDTEGTLSLHALAKALRVLVTEMSRDKFPGEQQALEEIARLLDDYRQGENMRLAPEEAARMIIEDIRDITFPLVLQQPGAEPLRVITPQPGHLHISLFGRGGYSGRPLTIVLGADASTLPREAAQNPVLLDSERRRINTDLQTSLPLAADTAANSARAFEGLLTRLQGEVIISWSTLNVHDGSARFPSRVLLDLLRRSDGDPTLQYDDLLAECGSPIGAAADEHPGSMAEWWLQQQRRCGSAATRHAMRAENALLDNGSRAEEFRDGQAFTVYDGHVPAGETPHPLPAAISASRLEALAACPYRYFLSRVLHLSPPEPWERDEHQWLDAALRGQAVHRILHLFMETLRARDTLPVVPEHAELLARLTHDVLAEYAERIPAPAALVRREEERSIRGMLRMFLREEEGSDLKPLALERAFGHARGDSDPLPALSLHVDGGSVSISGTIDRVDRGADGTILVRDYKTGSNRLDPKKGLHGGRVLQHALYAEAVRRLFPDVAEDEDVHAEYMFLSLKEQGARVRMPDVRTDLPTALGAMRALITEGIYPHSTERQDCRYCDFAELCGDAERVCTQSTRKRDHDGNAMLKDFRRMQDV